MAFSFLNGKSPFDEAEERLENGETELGRPKLPKAPVASWQDAVALLVIIGIIVGVYQYYQYSKKTSAESFARCDVIYTEAETEVQKYAEAEACYDSTWQLGFVSDSMEILRQERLSFIDNKRFFQKDLLEEAKAELQKRDTLKALSLLENYKDAMLLKGREDEEWKEILSLKK